MGSISKEALLKALGDMSSAAFKHAMELKLISDDVEKIPDDDPEENWIPIEERRPKPGQKVLITYEHDGFLGVGLDAIYSAENLMWLPSEKISVEVIAWLPLPEPYKEEENEKR